MSQASLSQQAPCRQLHPYKHSNPGSEGYPAWPRSHRPLCLFLYRARQGWWQEGEGAQSYLFLPLAQGLNPTLSPLLTVRPIVTCGCALDPQFCCPGGVCTSLCFYGPGRGHSGGSITFLSWQLHLRPACPRAWNSTCSPRGPSLHLPDNFLESPQEPLQGG